MKLLLGNEAVARGLYEAGCRFVSSYPGTPSTEAAEFASTYDEIFSEWAPNEKVAMEAAFGASVAGARSFCSMKHVGLNVAADPLFTASYAGINAGMVIMTADDPGMHSSQNEQDSRHYALASKTMTLEPSDSAECLDYTKRAFELSEKFDAPVMIRLTTRVAHSRSVVTLSERTDAGLKKYVKNPKKYVMTPANSRVKRGIVEQRLAAETAYCEKEAVENGLNKTEYYDKKIGVITSGICYQYAKEALGERASYLKLGCVYPTPVELLKKFAAECEKIYVVEELDDYLETQCRKNGIDVVGKSAFTFQGEYSQRMLSEVILGEKKDYYKLDKAVALRPPTLCPGCPHRGLFYVLKRLNLTVSGDIGCYTLGSAPPLESIDTVLCMGASVSALHGMNAVDPENAKKRVAVIGDSTFIHSGMTGLTNIAYNATNSVVVILDNSITGMTGRQQNPTSGFNIKGEPANAASIEKLADAIGISNVRVVDPYDLEETTNGIKEALESDGPAIVVSRRPCTLLKNAERNPPLKINAEKCVGCKMCMKLGCPAISVKNGKAGIDPNQCIGCGVCAQLCGFDAVERGGE